MLVCSGATKGNLCEESQRRIPVEEKFSSALRSDKQIPANTVLYQTPSWDNNVLRPLVNVSPVTKQDGAAVYPMSGGVHLFVTMTSERQGYFLPLHENMSLMTSCKGPGARIKFPRLKLHMLGSCLKACEE